MDTTAASCHFTYSVPKATSDLQQGDVVAKTAGVLSMLRDVHSYYAENETYSHFLVLTQACDLVRRDGTKCKAKYISLAAVRPLSLVLDREISSQQDAFDKAAGVCAASKRTAIEQFLNKVLNNNEPELFYLEPEPTLSFYEASCAFLRLSVAVRADLHYETLRNARVLALTDVFQAKLGWLLGNMYSRVGTPDWVPEALPPPLFKQKVADLLDNQIVWVDGEQLRAAKKKKVPTDAAPAQLRELIQATQAPSKKDRAIEVVVKVLRDQGVVQDDAGAESIRTRLHNEPDFKV